MKTSPQMPPGYDGHLEVCEVLGQQPMTPEQWEWVLAESEQMPGTMDPEFPEDTPQKPPQARS